MATVNDHRTLDCPLCFKRFSTPRVLPCCHTFCQKCLGDNIESQVGRQGGSIFMCPLCTTPIAPSDSNLSIEKWASTFPLNTAINSLLELESTKILDTSDRSCEPCKSDGVTRTAEVWCIECGERFCNSCYKSHQRIKNIQCHETVQVDKIGQYIQAKCNFGYECVRHNERVKRFCLDHRELCCAVCVDSNHCQCDDVRSIDDITRNQSQRSMLDYPSIIRDFNNLKTEMEKIMANKKTNTKEVLQKKDKILHDMDSRIDTIMTSHLSKLKTAFREETERAYKDIESSMLENENNVQSFMTNVDNSSEILEVVEKNGTLQQKFTTFEHLRSQIISHYNQLNLRLKSDVEVHLNLNTSKFQSDLEKTLKSVGSVEVSKTPSTTSRDILHGTDKILNNMNFRTKISTEMRAAQVEKVEDLMTSPVTFVKSATRDELGGSTWFSGGTRLGNGRLVMCDYNNRRVVELDDEYKIVKEYKVDGPPTDVTAGNNDNEIYIAVITFNDRYIYHCTLDTDLTIISRIKAPSNTWGLAVSGDNIIVGTREAVVILTQDGSTVRSIPKEGGNSYVAVSPTQRTIYHRDNHDVVCRTWEGQEVFRYQHQQLKVPHGMRVDRHGNLYICGMGSHNVHQVTSSDGQRSRIIELHNIYRPYSVILHQQETQLVVTSYNEDPVCEVYRLA